MKHPAQVARLLQPPPAWKIEPGSTDFSGERWEDACYAMAGAGDLAVAAFLWIHDRDPAARRTLEHHLLGIVGELSNGVAPGELVALALDEVHAPEAQRRDDLRALVLDVVPSHWRRVYRRPHAALLAELDSLAGDAWRCIRQRSDDVM